MLLSVIIPAYNSGENLEKCIASVKNSSYQPYEIIVVDDCSKCNLSDTVSEAGVKFFRLPCRTGPSAARNLGASNAAGDILLFIDSDVIVHMDSVERVIKDFNEHPEIIAIFGSYDDDPAEIDFFSQYKNLLHHFTHQNSSIEAETFWAGFGAVRKNVFDELGGFDAKKYPSPCIEDIEFGNRIRRKGYRILLDKAIQVKHLKKWNFRTLVRTDILCRAIPWAMLMLESGKVTKDLNLSISQKVSAGLVLFLAFIFGMSLYTPKMLYFTIPALLLIFALNIHLLSFFVVRNGYVFMVKAFLMHLLYLFYSANCFIVCWAVCRIRQEFRGYWGDKGRKS